jgi:hypothetical protein
MGSCLIRECVGDWQTQTSMTAESKSGKEVVVLVEWARDLA